MTKLSQHDRASMIKHLRELSILSQKSNSKHSKNIEKQISHTIELTKFIKEDRSKISRLENVIDMKQREIDELNSKQMDLLWDLAKLEKENITMKKEMAEDELRSAQVQKNIKQFIDNESTDN
tara:strand:+ start:197 stop:565 length:369 start_codon:yes stop_codon:yes gene_type:complete